MHKIWLECLESNSLDPLKRKTKEEIEEAFYDPPLPDFLSTKQWDDWMVELFSWNLRQKVEVSLKELPVCSFEALPIESYFCFAGKNHQRTYKKIGKDSFTSIQDFTRFKGIWRMEDTAINVIDLTFNTKLWMDLLKNTSKYELQRFDCLASYSVSFSRDWSPYQRFHPHPPDSKPKKRAEQFVHFFLLDNILTQIKPEPRYPIRSEFIGSRVLPFKCESVWCNNAGQKSETVKLNILVKAEGYGLTFDGEEMLTTFKSLLVSSFVTDNYSVNLKWSRSRPVSYQSQPFLTCPVCNNYFEVKLMDELEDDWTSLKHDDITICPNCYYGNTVILDTEELSTLNPPEYVQVGCNCFAVDMEIYSSLI